MRRRIINKIWISKRAEADGYDFIVPTYIGVGREYICKKVVYRNFKSVYAKGPAKVITRYRLLRDFKDKL